MEKLVVFFIAVAEEQTPVAQQGEVAVAEWVEAGEAVERLTYEQDRRIFRRALKYLLARPLRNDRHAPRPGRGAPFIRPAAKSTKMRAELFKEIHKSNNIAIFFLYNNAA